MKTIKMYFRTSNKLKQCEKRNDTVSKKINFIGVLNKHKTLIRNLEDNFTLKQKCENSNNKD